jgi:site-specific DNA-methyltransferase (adenine-specific)
MQDFLDNIICGDCIKALSQVKKPFADLIFADPPFNIGYKYDKYNDRQKKQHYIKWTKEWMTACYKVLKPYGSFYIAIGDDYAAYVKMIAEKKLKLFCRNWIIWHYNFGQQMKDKFARSHTHIFYFVKNKNEFVFNDNEVRMISDRQGRYKDKRASRDGKMPDDVWDVYPRVCGTFDERTNFPCQMPESLLARIIRVSSNEGDWILDPFSGSGTTAAVAAKLKRNYTGIELSPKYAKKSEKRIKEFGGSSIEGEGPLKWTEQMEKELKWLYHENKVPTEQLEDNDYLLELFTEKFNSRIGNKSNRVDQKEICKRLRKLRKSGKLGALRGERVRANGVKAN